MAIISLNEELTLAIGETMKRINKNCSSLFDLSCSSHACVASKNLKRSKSFRLDVFRSRMIEGCQGRNGASQCCTYEAALPIVIGKAESEDRGRQSCRRSSSDPANVSSA